MKYNPFMPGSLVHPGMFAGRKNEIEAIEKCLFQTKQGNPQNFFIQGERGIGKSSLVLYAKYLAIGQLKNSYKFIVIQADLEPHYGFLDVIEKLIAEAESELSNNNKFEFLKKLSKDSLSQLQSSYISFKRQEIPKNMLITNIANLFKKMSEQEGIDGVLILIDEADKPSSDAELGSLFKLLSEKLFKINCNNVCLGISGLPETTDKLRTSHESSLRIFEVLTLEPLNANESKQAIDIGMSSANERNKFETKFDKEAENLIIELSEGYPYFLQQFCYSSFEADTDKVIDKHDVDKGIYDENKGALNQLGKKLFDNMFYNKIESKDYRKVLQFMASRNEKWVTRSSILEHSSLKKSTINNAIKALKERHIIFDNANIKGEYRLLSKSFAIWINVSTHKKQNGIYISS